MSELAINGGSKVREKPFPPYPVIGEEEKKAAIQVLEEGRLSVFLASAGIAFGGGKNIKELETLCEQYHNVKHAVVFNSATAALHAAVIACGVKPGEEVITTPYTFTSCATCALMANTVPVFADVNADTFNISPQEIEKKISPLTKAIIAVHLFGNPCAMDEILDIAKKHNLKVIEDCAQSPGAKYKGKLAGTIGDCGILSFTENKNITSGEGGALLTNNDYIAEIASLIRNHGECVVATEKKKYDVPIIGYNYRMPEIDAAIGVQQFKKMDSFNQTRIDLSKQLYDGVKDIPGLTPQKTNPDDKNVYYITTFKYDEEKMGIPMQKFVQALNAEGIVFWCGYVKPLYTMPLYHDNKPKYIYDHYKGNASYEDGTCPTTEMLHTKGIVLTPLCRPPATKEDIDDIIKAMHKVYKYRDELK